MLNKTINRFVFGVMFIMVMAYSLLTHQAFAQISLGQTRVYSTIGQPLNATIDIHASPQDLSTIRGRSYRLGNGGQIDPSITTRIVAGQTGAMVQLGSLIPMNEPFVDVVVELVSDGGASIARNFTMLINPSTGFITPPIGASKPKRIKYTGTRKKSKTSVLSSLNAQIARAKKELKTLEAQLANIAKAVNKPNKVVASVAPTLPVEPENPATTANNGTPTKINIPSPSDVLNKINIPNPSDVLNNAVGKINQAISKLTVSKPATPPVIITPPPRVINKPPPLAPKTGTRAPSRSAAVTSRTPVVAKNKGLFGFDFLPSAESLGLGGISEGILLATGVILLIIAILIVFVLSRSDGSKRRSSNASYMSESNDVFGETPDVFSSGGAANDSDTNTVEESKPKKQSFMSKFKLKKKAAAAEEEVDENVDFAALVENQQKQKKTSKKSKPSKNNTDGVGKIERFTEEKTTVYEEDFLGDLEHLTNLPASKEESTVMVFSKEEDTSLAPEKIDFNAIEEKEKEEEESFNDKITRIPTGSGAVQLDEDNDPVTTAFNEMLSEEISAPVESLKSKAPSISDELFDGGKSNSLLTEMSSDLNIDELDFSAEKTMIMPSLDEMGSASYDDTSDKAASDFEFSLNTDEPMASPPTKPKEKPSKEKTPKESKKKEITKMNVPYMEDSPTMLMPTIDEKPPTVFVPNVSDGAATTLMPSLDEDMSTASPPDISEKPPTVATSDINKKPPTVSLPDMEEQAASAKQNIMEGLDLPGLDLDLGLPTGKSKSTQSKKKDEDKEDGNMIDLAGLDLSSIKFD